MIIDAHCHAGIGDKLTSPWTTRAPLGKYLQRAKAVGISKTIVMPPGHSDYTVANRQLARIVQKHRPRLVGLAGVHATHDAGRIREMLEEAVYDFGFRGVKVHGHDAFPTRELCEVVKSLRIPMLLDIIGEPSTLDLIAEEYPDINFVIPHLGSFADDWKAQRRIIDLLVRFPNVFADTSGVRRFDYLAEAVQRAGPRKVLFGSDGPWLHPGLELHKVRLLNLSPADTALILGGNAGHIFRASTDSAFHGQSRPALLAHVRGKEHPRAV